MNELELNYGDLIIVDPCYIKSVECCGEQRFDALRLVKSVHEGDDGEYLVKWGGDKESYLGVDSGRLWVYMVEFSVKVSIDSGYSGHTIILRGEKSIDQMFEIANSVEAR